MKHQISVLDPQTIVHCDRGTVFIARCDAKAKQTNIHATVFGAGSIDDPIGAAHLLEHCKLRQPLREGIEINGGRLAGGTGLVNTTYWGYAPDHCANSLIQATAEATCRAEFSKESFRYEHAEVLAECAYDSLNEVGRLFKLRLKAVVTPDLTRRYEAYSDIDKLTYSDIVSFFTSTHFSDRLFVAIEGPADAPKMIDIAQEHFVLPRGPEASIRKFPFHPSTIVAPEDNAVATQVSILIEHPDISYNPVDNFLYSIARQYLASAIYFKTKWDREQSLVRNIESIFVTPDDHMQASGYAFVAQPQNIQMIIEAISDTIRGGFSASQRNTDIMNNTLTRLKDEELKRVPTVDQLSVRSLVNSAFWANTIYPPDHVKKVLASITPETVEHFINRYFLNGRCSLIYRGYVDSAYPDHKAVAELFQTDTIPRRTAETDGRLLSKLGDPHHEISPPK